MDRSAALRLPLVGPRCLPILRRHFLVWRKLAGPSLLGNVADPLITLLAFGYGLGKLLPEVGGVRYIEFLAAGSLCMSTMMAASFEALYSAFSRMHVQRTWDSLMNAPLELDDVLASEWLWAGIKSVFSATAIVVVVFVLDVSRTPLLLLALPAAALLGLCFSAMALCVNALARGYDFFTYWFTLVLTPMTFLSGVWYPRDAMPEWLATIGGFLPLAAAVDLVRPLVLGAAPPHPVRSLVILLLCTFGALWLAAVLTRRRFGR